MDTSSILFNALILGVMFIGLAGLVLPIFPGLVVIWLATLGYGMLAGFGTLGWIMFALITVLMIVGSVVDNVLMGKKAHDSGAAWFSVLLALLFGLIGNFIFPILGGFIGALLALFIAEWIRRRNWRDAASATRGWATGCGWAVAIRFLMGLVMIGLWLIWALV